MQRSTAEAPVTFRCGALSLEGWLALPPSATRAAVVCHPHPQYGGDMDNEVVVAVTEALGKRAVATLRFNFRGVGASEGSYGGGFGEIDDALAAVAAVRERVPGATLTLGGYSFGAMVALGAGYDRAEIERLFAVALPATMFDAQRVATSPKPKLFVLGDRDSYCPVPALERMVGTFAGANEIVKLDGADHFFFGFAQAVGEAVAGFVAG